MNDEQAKTPEYEEQDPQEETETDRTTAPLVDPALLSDAAVRMDPPAEPYADIRDAPPQYPPPHQVTQPHAPLGDPGNPHPAPGFPSCDAAFAAIAPGLDERGRVEELVAFLDEQQAVIVDQDHRGAAHAVERRGRVQDFARFLRARHPS